MGAQEKLDVGLQVVWPVRALLLGRVDSPDCCANKTTRYAHQLLHTPNDSSANVTLHNYTLHMDLLAHIPDYSGVITY